MSIDETPPWIEQTDEQYNENRFTGGGDDMDHSSFKVWQDNPAKAYAMHNGEGRTKTTEPMYHGTCFHGDTLLDDRSDWNIWPEHLYDKAGRRNTRCEEGKALKEEHQHWLNADDIYMLENMKLSVHSHPYARDLMDGAVFEKVIKSGETVPCMAKVDILNVTKSRIADLKSCQSVLKFHHDIRTRKYDQQLAYYRRIWYHLTGEWFECFIIAVEKTWPFTCGIFEIADHLLEVNHLQIETDLQKFLNESQFDSWPTRFERPILYPTETYNYAKGRPYDESDL